MRQLTLREFDKELERRLKHLAESEDLSLNKTVLRLLRKATGLEDSAPFPLRVGDSLDEFIGIWTLTEQREFDEATQVFEETDEELWS